MSVGEISYSGNSQTAAPRPAERMHYLAIPGDRYKFSRGLSEAPSGSCVATVAGELFDKIEIIRSAPLHFSVSKYNITCGNIVV